VISFPSQTNCRRLFRFDISLEIVVKRLYDISKCRRLIKPNRLLKLKEKIILLIDHFLPIGK
jgi:ferritin-like protein